MIPGLSGPLAAALLAFGAVALGVLALAGLVEGFRGLSKTRAASRELRRLRTNQGVSSKGSDLLRDRKGSMPEWLRPVMAALPSYRDLELLLEQAHSSIGVGTLLLLSAGMALAFGAALAVATGTILLAIPGAAFGAVVPLLLVMRQRRKRFQAFEEAFPEAIDLMARAARAGHAFTGTLKVVAEEAPDPVGAEFRQVFEEQKFGLPVSESLLGLSDRMNILDVRMFVTSVLIHKETGGNLAENLDGLSRVIRERFKFKRDVHTKTAHGRMTGLVLVATPIVLLIAFQLLNPEYVRPLFVERAGQYMLAGAAVLQVIGYLITKRLTNIEL
jgi:tight adherence protein B